MVLIVFRASLEPEVMTVLAMHDVRGYTHLPRVVGVGEAGARLDSFEQPGFNSLILTALDDVEAQRLVDGLREFRDDAVARQHGTTIPLRAFVLPCVQAI